MPLPWLVLVLTISCKSFGGVIFDLGPLLQGKMMVGQHKSVTISITIGSKGL